MENTWFNENNYKCYPVKEVAVDGIVLIVHKYYHRKMRKWVYDIIDKRDMKSQG